MKIISKRIIDEKTDVYCGTVQNEFHGFVLSTSMLGRNCLQNENAGAQAFSSFDTYLAPYVRNDKLTYQQVYDAIQEFVFNVNVPSRWGTQTPFTNLTFDLVCPEDLKDSQPIIDGEEMDYTYSELQTEMDMINKAFMEVMMKGDAKGRLFTFPIPTYNITPDFQWNTEISDLLFEMTAKYGLPYFQNFLNSDLKVGDVRSMCPLTGDTKVLVRINGERKDIAIGELYRLYQEDNEFSFEVWDKEKWCKARPNYQGKQKYLTISLVNGISVKMGNEHLQCLANGSVKKACELLTGDQLPIAIMNSTYRFENASGISGTIPICKIEKSEDEQDLYCLEVDNENHLFTLADGLLTHNCRLQLDLREIRKRGGGLFGSGEQTGSVGVITINCARLGYLYKNDITGMYKQLDHWLHVAKDALEQKRKALIRWMEQGLYPYSKRYLGTYNTLFSTIGINGVNEMIRNFTNDEHDITDDYGQKFAINLMDHIREKLVEFQVETGNLYNLEATPAEGCFAYDTEVMTLEYGLQKIGDLVGKSSVHVLSYNEHKCMTRYGKTLWIRQTGVKKVMLVKFQDGSVFKCTPNHPFALRHVSKGTGEVLEYVEAKDLLRGMPIKSCDRNRVVQIVDSVEQTDEVIPVYNMEVEKSHNYFVGGEKGVLVHNCTYRFAKEDKKRYPDVLQAGKPEAPYYTNSTQLPVGYTDDPFTALDLQENLQKKYSGGTVLHLYMGEKVSSGEMCKLLVKRVLENYRVPYITITPTFSICPKHGYISGEHKYCPICDEELINVKREQCESCGD